MKTIAQQLNITEFPFRIKDSKGNLIYWENSDRFWFKKEYDSKGNEIYYENPKGYWEKSKYDSNRKLISYENSDRFWFKKEYDSEGNQIYFKNSFGIIVDNRPKVVELTMDEIADKLGIDVNLLRVKK